LVTIFVFDKFPLPSTLVLPHPCPTAAPAPVIANMLISIKKTQILAIQNVNHFNPKTHTSTRKTKPPLIKVKEKYHTKTPLGYQKAVLIN